MVECCGAKGEMEYSVEPRPRLYLFTLFSRPGRSSFLASSPRGFEGIDAECA